MKRLLDWLHDRSGYRAWLEVALEEPVPGGASWAFVFGSVVAFILVLQMVTGIILAMYYSPSSSGAWASVAYVQDQVSLGWFIRGLHSQGASAMVLVTAAHMAQVFLYGAYKKPRELNWLIGLAMFGLILAFALTGYLLPWDQKGYNATKVATNIMGGLPLIGRTIQRFVQGGNDYGNLTLTRFYATHVILLPGAILTLLIAHVALFRKHGVTPRWGKSKDFLARHTEPFWPDQLWRDVVVMLLVVGVMIALTVSTHGAELAAPADPSRPYEARPEWYFLPLFQLLKYFSGSSAIVGSVVLPGLFALLLAALPFLDRGPASAPGARGVFVALFAAAGAAVLTLGLLAWHHDHNDPVYKKNIAHAAFEGQIARAYVASQGFPEGGRVPTTPRELVDAMKPKVDPNDPQAKLDDVWQTRCMGCHTVNGLGPDGSGKGPDFGGYNTRPWIRGFLTDPRGKLYYGGTKTFSVKGMKPVKAQGDDLTALVEFVYARQGPDLAPDVDPSLVAKGQTLFESDAMGCTNCHSIKEGEEGDGPNLNLRGTRKFLEQVVRDGSVNWLYGVKNEMPKFGEKLSDAEISALVGRVLALHQPAPR